MSAFIKKTSLGKRDSVFLPFILLFVHCWWVRGISIGIHSSHSPWLQEQAKDYVKNETKLLPRLSIIVSSGIELTLLFNILQGFIRLQLSKMLRNGTRAISRVNKAILECLI